MFWIDVGVIATLSLRMVLLGPTRRLLDTENISSSLAS